MLPKIALQPQRLLCGHSGPLLPHQLRWSDQDEVAHSWGLHLWDGGLEHQVWATGFLHLHFPLPGILHEPIYGGSLMRGLISVMWVREVKLGGDRLLPVTDFGRQALGL